MRRFRPGVISNPSPALGRRGPLCRSRRRGLKPTLGRGWLPGSGWPPPPGTARRGPYPGNLRKRQSTNYNQSVRQATIVRQPLSVVGHLGRPLSYVKTRKQNSSSLATRRGHQPTRSAIGGNMAQNLALFNGYIAVDWSASARPGQGRNTIWIAVLGPGSQLPGPEPRHLIRRCNTRPG